jgi:transcription elongation GreA/GreB family factor
MSDEVKNYITPGGYRRLQEELARLWQVERPPVVTTLAWAAGNGDRSENGDYIYGKRKLREIDRRIRHLSKRLDLAVVVDNSRKTASPFARRVDPSGSISSPCATTTSLGAHPFRVAQHRQA